jgi:hypothetical protein
VSVLRNALANILVIIRTICLAACVLGGLTGTAAADCVSFFLNPNPCVTSLSPSNTGAAGEGITISGAGFKQFTAPLGSFAPFQTFTVSGTPLVTLAGVPATNVVVKDDNTLYVQPGVPPVGPLPSGPVVVTTTVTSSGNYCSSNTCSGLTSNTNVTFTYESTMSITALPSATSQIGSNYSQANNVTGGNGPYTCSVSSGTLPPGTTLSLSAHTATSATCLVSGVITGPATSFSYTIQVTDTNQQSVTAGTTGATAPPTISGVSPSSGPQAGGQSIIISGSFLAGATSVTIGGKSVAFTPLSGGSQISLTTPAAASAGTVDIQVTTPAGTTPISAADQYTYNPGPNISSVSPPAGPLAGGQTITINGSNFSPTTIGTFVNIGGVSATVTNVTSGTITAITPANTAAGPENVQVIQAFFGGQATAINAYTYQAPPTITQIVPPAGPLAGGQSVTIYGQNFTGATSVAFGTATVTLTPAMVTATSITLTTPASTTQGQVSVAVITPGPQTGTGTYTYTGLPAVTQVTPGSGPLTAGQPVTITGMNFVAGNTSISFGSTLATNVVVNSNGTQITALAPAGSGTVQVSATTPSGTGTQTAPYTYTSLPIVTAVSPPTGPVAGGQTVTISGQNFTGATKVQFGSSIITPVTVGGGGTSITIVTPSATSPGPVSVSVTTPLGTGTGVNLYTYVAPLTIAATPAATQQVGQTYSQQNTASGGTPPYTYTLTGGSPPAGTSLSSSTGLVFGTATVSGPYSYTITVTDSTAPALTAFVTVSGNISAIVSSVTLTSSVNPSLLGQPTTLTAAVSPNSCTGTITFFDGATALCSAVPTTNGVASCTVKFSSAGQHPLKASYSGSAKCTAGVSAILAQVVNDQRPQTVATIGNFLSRRNDLILSGEPDRKREVDRLVEAGDAMDGRSIRSVPFAVMGTGLATYGNSGASTGGGDLAGMPPGPGFASAPQLMMSPNALGFNSTRSPLAAGTSISSINGTSDWNAPMGAGSLAAGPMRIVGSTEGLATFGFSTSLRDLLHFNAATEAAKAADAGQGFTAGSKYNPAAYYSPFDIWVEGKYTSFRDSSLPGSSSNALSGEFGLFTVGADYVFSRWLLAGVMAQYDLMYQHTPSAGSTSNASGQGWTVGPYATVRLSENVFWQARGAWGQSSNEVSPYGTYTDNFESQRWLASTALQGRWTYGNWMFRPSASVAYMQDNANSYVDSFGVLIPEVKSELGQAKAGPEFGYRYQYSPDLIVEPHLGMQAIYNFAGSVTSSIGLVPGENAGPNGVRGRVEVGQRAVTSGGVALDLAGSYDGIGVKGYDAYSARAQVHVPLD